MHCLQCFSCKEILTSTRPIVWLSTVSKLLGYQKKVRIHWNSKIITSRCRCHLWFTQILRPLLKRYKGASLIIPNNIPTNIKSTLAAVIEVVCCYDGQYTKPVQIYRSEKPIKKFVEEMLKEVQYCQKIIATKFKKPLMMSDEDEQHFQASN